MRYDGLMDERDFFTERPEQKPAQYSCPRCKRRNEYMVRWMRRTKKKSLPPGADARDRRIAELEQQIEKRDQVIGEYTIANRILKKLSGQSV